CFHPACSDFSASASVRMVSAPLRVSRSPLSLIARTREGGCEDARCMSRAPRVANVPPRVSTAVARIKPRRGQKSANFEARQHAYGDGHLVRAFRMPAFARAIVHQRCLGARLGGT